MSRPQKTNLHIFEDFLHDTFNPHNETPENRKLFGSASKRRRYARYAHNKEDFFCILGEFVFNIKPNFVDELLFTFELTNGIDFYKLKQIQAEQNANRRI